MRLPLQIGRASLNQGARFAACVWLGPLLLILAAMIKPVAVSAFVLGLPGILCIMLAILAADIAKTDRASDIVLDDSGFVIEGGPLDKTHCKWSQISSCEIVKGDPRRAVRWLLLSWITFRQVASINERARVPVQQLELSLEGGKKLVLAEAEGDEIDSLQQLRDSILGAVTPPTAPAALPQEILTCPHCRAPLVPAATPRMTCNYCQHDLDVPAELQQRVKASIELDQSSGPRASEIKQLVDQPSARRAAVVIAQCRRLMVWIQPVALGVWIYLVAKALSDAKSQSGVFIARTAPSDDYVGFYDLALFALVVAAAFAIAWSIGHAYIANRQALRMLADNFGAVPPAKPGAPSTCHNCNAPLPATNALLVHCAYCATENVLGVDPRPAALRRKRERIDLDRGLGRRRRARIQRWITIPVAAVLAVALAREVRMAWNVPSHYIVPPGFEQTTCDGWCGTVTNSDSIRRTFTFVTDGKRVATTLLAHGAVTWDCEHECTIELGKTRVTPKPDVKTDLRIAHGILQ